MQRDLLHLTRGLLVKEKVYSASVVLIPLLVSIYAVCSGMLWHIHGFTLGLLIVCYCCTVIGVTVGYHRLLTHRSFKSNRIVKMILTALGCMSYEGPPYFWIAAHRRHHKHTEKEHDPHSPIVPAGNRFKRFFHSHVGWMLTHTLESWRHYIPELLNDVDIRMINRRYDLIALMGILLPGAINGLYFMSWFHFVEGIVICGFFRVFLQQNVTWSINSVCHLWGRRDFEAKDNSRNNLAFGYLALGEGWHNGHHAFPSSARHGFLWYQLDVSYLLIKFLSLIGLAHSIRVPSCDDLNSKRIR